MYVIHFKVWKALRDTKVSCGAFSMHGIFYN